MRRFWIFCLCAAMLVGTAAASNHISDFTSTTVVSSDGSCEVSLILQLELDTMPEELSFPLPSQARDISVNGSSVFAFVSGGVRQVDLTGAVATAGVHTVSIHYSLPDSITVSGGKLYLNLQLLSGFAYAIDAMSFSISLPGAVEYEPSFTSVYYGEDIESYIRTTVEDNTLSGYFTTTLNDSEQVEMSLQVSQEQFPQTIAKQWSLSWDDVLLGTFLLLALLYWLLTMRALPVIRGGRSMPPEGVSAGDLGYCMALDGLDLTMLAFSWAQMGYIFMHLTDRGRVTLHRRMDMGNERPGFERRLFERLFGSRASVDACGEHYARLYMEARRMTPKRVLMRRGSGSPRVFRLLCSASAVCGGYSLAHAFTTDTVLRTALTVVLMVLAYVASRRIQEGAGKLLLRDRWPVLLALLCSAVWILLGIFASEAGVALFCVAAQWIAGTMAFFGGRRTGYGKELQSGLLSLRWFMQTASPKKLRALQSRNPDYFYRLAPMAMAMGVGRSFARRFGSGRLPGCPYLSTGLDGHRTAREWMDLMAEAAAAMDERQKRSRIDQLLRRSRR
ncbi:MAG: DUF2207 domain-containing protein [Firmicutes bacterium]|nr:DUF2207 domain-containing protein [Bacillota bacterium]